MAAITEPRLRREGNMRLAALPCDGLPEEPEPLRAEVLNLLAEQEGIAPHGPLTVLFDLPPEGEDPRTWRCLVGSPITGFPRPRPPLLIEDYAGLQALALPHFGPLRELAASWRLLSEHARAHGWTPRPYWRLALHRRQTADGNLFPEPELSVFVDR